MTLPQTQTDLDISLVQCCQFIDLLPILPHHFHPPLSYGMAEAGRVHWSKKKGLTLTKQTMQGLYVDFEA